MQTRILLKTTISAIPDDWNVGRFSLLVEHLRALTDSSGRTLYDVFARDRVEDGARRDADLEDAAAGAYDQLWLIAADTTGALTSEDVENISRFRANGGGILLTRDHQDLGACLTKLGPVGATQYFHTVNVDPDGSHQCRDDIDTPSISWPNFHSGANGDLQTISVLEPIHPLMRVAEGRLIRRLPAHPHEGSVGVPASLQQSAREVAQGRSATTGAAFNICVAIEEPKQGRVVSDSSFHHFCDYNWNTQLGCPSFVDEPPGAQINSEPDALHDGHCYVQNIAAWLAGRI